MGVLVAYYGGRVLSSAVVVALFWTSNVDVDLQQELGSFYSAILASSYVDWLEEYDTLGLTGVGGQPGSQQHIGRGRFAAAVTITPANQSTALADSDIAGELAAQIAAGTVPAPTLDAAGNVNTVYMVEVPPGYTVTYLGGVSCADFCAYHSTTSIGGQSVPYVVLPDSHACAGQVCGQGFDDETILRSHELAEAITDTESGRVPPAALVAGEDVYPMAWAADGGAKGEIGDLCFQGFVGDNAAVAGYQVQKLWSNFASGCVVGIPICAAGGTPPACRKCTTYDNGAACSGGESVCDEATGACRACEGAECGDAGADADASADAGARADTDTRLRAGCGVAPGAAFGSEGAFLAAAVALACRRRRRA